MSALGSCGVEKEEHDFALCESALLRCIPKGAVSKRRLNETKGLLTDRKEKREAQLG